MTFRIILGEKGWCISLVCLFFAFWRFDWLLDYVKAILFFEEWNGPGTPFAVNAAEKRVTFAFDPKTYVRLNEYTSTSL